MNHPLAFRRVVIGHGAVPGAEVLLDVAANLAEVAQADLFGLFVEETALLDLADLPFSQAVQSGSGISRNLSRAAVQDAFSAQAVAFRKALELRVKHLKLTCDFGTARGDLLGELSARCERGDIAVISAPAAGVTARDTLAMARQAMAQVNAVLIAPFASSKLAGPVVVIDEGSDTGRSAVLLGAQIAARANRAITVFIIAENEAEAKLAEQRNRDLLADTNAFYQQFSRLEVDQLVRGIAKARPWLMAADHKADLFSDDDAAISLIAASRAPVLLLHDI